MRRIFLATLLALAAAGGTASAQSPGCDYGGYAGGSYAGAYGGGSSGGYYRQSLYAGSPFGIFSFALRMYPLIHFHGPLVNYGPYEGYYPFQPYGPWTSDLKYQGGSTAGTGWIFGGGRGLGLGHGHGHQACGKHGCKTCGSHGHYALATFHNVGLRVHPFAHKCKNCSAAADAPKSDVVPVVAEATAAK